ncbi:MAG TPA: hypothetical protein PKC65_12265 [Pyrinomonadaceae bacterium]|nr:hypothetical protein [Pyrinomonadaceae bacterium]
MSKHLNVSIRVEIAILLLSFAAFTGFGQQPEAESSDKTLNSRVNIYHHLGSIQLPPDFAGYVGANWTDAWAGSISNGKIAIEWRAGMIEYVLEKRRKEVVSTNIESFGDFNTEFYRLRNKQGDTLVAKIGWLEFSVPISHKEDEALFMTIVRSFKNERCSICRSFPLKTKE